MDTQLISILISGLALLVAATTAYLTLFQRGALLMTRPTMIFFGPDGGSGVGPNGEWGPPKVFVRALLYSTSRRGHVIENMFLRLRRGETSQNFNIWIYRDQNLVRGSGLVISRDGKVSDHHFLLPKDGTQYSFAAGQYTVEVFATLANRKSPTLLSSQQVVLDTESSRQINEQHNGVFFDWGPDLGCYQSHVDTNPRNRLSVVLAREAV